MRLLIVSPHFPPSNTPDSQRVRLLSPYFAEMGVFATVLAVDPSCVRAPIDLWLLEGLPRDLIVNRVKGLGTRWCKVPGFGSLTNRVIGALKRSGNRELYLARKFGAPYDLVYFSTTQFGIHKLGPYWTKRYGVPFVMDYQDPWVNDYYSNNPQITPPGGKLKYAIASYLSRKTEPYVLKSCSGLTSVSETYPAQLRDRYSFIDTNFPVLIASFPGDQIDFDRVLRDTLLSQPVFDANDGFIHWVYVGAAGKIMETAIRGFFGALVLYLNDTKNCEFGRKLRVHFVGTSYAAAGHGVKTVECIAKEFGLGNVVKEQTDRIPYSQTLRCLLSADALIVPGSNDAGYTASKVYPYLLARKPMLAVFHEESSVKEVISRVGGATLVTFDNDRNVSKLTNDILKSWFKCRAFSLVKPFDSEKFKIYTARNQAESLANFFEKIIYQKKR